MRTKRILFALVVLAVTILACNFNFSSASIKDAKMTKDADGTQPATVFAQDDDFYCQVVLANAPDDTAVKASWIAVETEGMEPNLPIGERELVSGDGSLQFNLVNDKLWPVGKYKVDLYLNGKLDRSLDFQVEGQPAAAVTNTPEPEPTATPEPEDTPTPEPAATNTPEPEPTATPEPEEASTPVKSAGDQLQIAAPTPEAETPAAEATALPFKEEDYVHPSKAFGFSVPEGWEELNSDETSVSFSDNETILGMLFQDAEKEYTEAQMQTYVDTFTSSFMDVYADKSDVISQDTWKGGQIYVMRSYTDGETEGQADFIFEQQGRIIYVMYLITPQYDPLLPTWQGIVDSYWIDPDAALAAVGGSSNTGPVESPTRAPAPTPAPPSGPSIPAGKGLFIFKNQSGMDIVVDVIGPTNTSQVVPPGNSYQFILDPGHYAINAHTPSGQYISPYEFDIAAGESRSLSVS